MPAVTVKAASSVLLQRYLTLLDQPANDSAAGPEGTSLTHLRWMCATALEHAQAWPEDKLSRWLGFVQGVLCARGLLKVAEERSASRPLFHAAYEAGGTPVPNTAEPGISKTIAPVRAVANMDTTPTAQPPMAGDIAALAQAIDGIKLQLVRRCVAFQTHPGDDKAGAITQQEAYDDYIVKFSRAFRAFQGEPSVLPTSASAASTSPVPSATAASLELVAPRRRARP